MVDLEAARKELNEKSLEQIQKETAYKWASRALAARELFDQDQQFILDYNEYVHEALEHAALVEEDGFFQTVKDLFKV